ncbi:hypothetical protein H9Q70_007101 [Fusarium xylarioides]|nr:hypothetical protein H9Q70_007101 [Fusarium xylarioides]
MDATLPIAVWPVKCVTYPPIVSNLQCCHVPLFPTFPPTRLTITPPPLDYLGTLPTFTQNPIRKSAFNIMALRIGRQSETFGDYLRDVEGINFNNPDEESEIFQLLTASKELEVMARGFRVGAQATQDHQDCILAWYRLWVKKAVSISETLPEEEALDLACFPNPEGTDFRQLFQQIRMFLAFTISKSVPARVDDDVISYQTLVSYRSIIWF